MHARARAFCDLKRLVSLAAVRHDKGSGATLTTRGDRLIDLLLDGDPVGRRTMRRIHAALQASTGGQVLQLPPGTDPDDLCDATLTSRLGPLLA